MIYEEPLSEEHRSAVDRFRCTRYPHTEELAAFLRNDAFHEQRSRLSSTTLFFVDDSEEIDGFVTLSTSSIRTPPNFKNQHPERAYLPVIFLDYVAVADHRLEAESGFGHKLFSWALNKIVRDADAIGARLLMLEVRVGNWHAYRRYRERWGFEPLPLRGREPTAPPDHRLDTPPPAYDTSRLIPMYLDLAAAFGPPVVKED